MPRASQLSWLMPASGLAGGVPLVFLSGERVCSPGWTWEPKDTKADLENPTPSQQDPGPFDLGTFPGWVGMGGRHGTGDEPSSTQSGGLPTTQAAPTGEKEPGPCRCAWRWQGPFAVSLVVFRAPWGREAPSQPSPDPLPLCALPSAPLAPAVGSS